VIAMISASTFCMLMAAVYGGFGFTMLPMVNFFYGPESPMASALVRDATRTGPWWPIATCLKCGREAEASRLGCGVPPRAGCFV